SMTISVEKEFLFGFKYQRHRLADKDKEVAVTIDRLIEMIDLTKQRNDNPFHLIVVFPWTLSWLGTPGLSSTGLLYGIQQSGRTLAGVLAALILLFTPTPSGVVWAFFKLHLPPAAGLA